MTISVQQHAFEPHSYAKDYNSHAVPQNQSWTAPESWATIPRDGVIERDGTSDDEDYGRGAGEPTRPPSPTAASLRAARAEALHRPPSLKRGREKSLPEPPPLSPGAVDLRKHTTTSIRIYRVDGQYHVVNCPSKTTVSDMRTALTKRLGIRGDTHRLYLREKGRERALGSREEPAMILRRRLEQAGYSSTDDIDALGGENLGFLLRFIFRSASLGGIEADNELFPSGFEHIDLAERGLETVPVKLHQHASSIITLNLSKNPLIDIPLDFVQACSSLRELRLSHVAIKKVPKAIRHIKSLEWLDISCNRILELEQAGLEEIPGLRQIHVQNNRLASLPSSFAHMRSLKFLNISNNKFEQLPPVVSSISTLVDLDVSFNSITALPPGIGNLTQLQRLIIVGNRFTSLPPECRCLFSLRELDCRRNLITDLSILSDLPLLESLLAEHNTVHVLDFAVGPNMNALVASHNPATKFTLRAPLPDTHYKLTSLDLSHMKLSTWDDDGAVLASFPSLVSLSLNYNKFHTIPDTISSLSNLEYLSCTNNDLHTLPPEIGKLSKLRVLSVHNNSIKMLPESIWECGQLKDLNASSNLLDMWQDPAMSMSSPVLVGSLPSSESISLDPPERKGSAAGLSATSRTVPPLANSLERLLLADNHLGMGAHGFDIFRVLTLMRELRVLNLSFNQIAEFPSLPPQIFTHMQELYLSGNNLTTLPGEEMSKLSKVKVLYLNGNKLHTLPAELRRVSGLETLDVGNNLLKYNIANWQYDWNWNFNTELKYLNLSGNKRLEIKAQIQPTTADSKSAGVTPPLFDFANLSKLRVLGLMDVTLVAPSVPDDNQDRRVRTSDTEINGMAYGISDTLGISEGPTTFDLALRNFRGRRDESLFGMFGRAQPTAGTNRAAKFLHENFSKALTDALGHSSFRGSALTIEDVPEAMRNACLSLNRSLYEYLGNKGVDAATGRKSSVISATGPVDRELKSGASGVVVYIQDRPTAKIMYVANLGNMLAVVSRSDGTAHLVSTKHDPFERSEATRIRAAEGWVSPKGMVNDEEDLSRSFGLFHLLPAVNARPDVREYRLTEKDELVIIGNRGLWDYVSVQTAVDIARQHRVEPMKAAQTLRDFAMSYGANGNTVIMVVAVADLFGPSSLSRQAAEDPYAYMYRRGAPRKERDRLLTLLDEEVPPPRGSLALVFTDIRNSTSLWEKNAGMSVAMKLHNELLRRQLRLIGGYEVKTEGDSFMCSFHSVAAAMLWCFVVQTELLKCDWPIEILESEEGGEVFDSEGRLVARGLSVRMGVHWGKPVCADDPVTSRVDYFGPMVNRSARIMGQAQGGQIMVSSDVLRELDRADEATDQHLAALRNFGVHLHEVGERSLKGLEVPETLSLVFPKPLVGRLELSSSPFPVTGSRVHFNVDQIKELTLLAVRLETLASSRVFRPLARKSLSPSTSEDLARRDSTQNPVFLIADPEPLMPNVKSDPSDQDLLFLLDVLTSRIQNALVALQLSHAFHTQQVRGGAIDAHELIQQLMDTLNIASSH
ncbi:uncharacterized protein EI90DRAFT_2918120 [Cantharellus anzutake]|uniref:uncharacterized protein n=1 Tax=Cantharellus anzutake TaxID=1750568 RepID=UPI0019038EBC|nr:uncharacterized protein EI90DRAFT_2918120 [Cantharellus anzutake]KAF8332698.1 hypothetical protein EI90DRAFT_2918120 [Cantharellus anzutake]